MKSPTKKIFRNISLTFSLATMMILAASNSASAALLFSVEEGGPSGLIGNGIYQAPDAGIVGTINDVQEVNGFSFNEKLHEFFRLCFSIDQLSRGLDNTHARVEADKPIPEHMGDAFISRGIYNRYGYVSGGLGHDLAIDQADLGLLPGDELNGASDGEFGTDPIYYTGSNSANIFYQSISNLFASATDLNLSNLDDINALVVWDDNNDGVFNGTDQILFSLDRNSALLLSNPAWSAADVFSLKYGGAITLFASHEDLGLRFEDNLDALELISGDKKDIPEPTTTIGLFSLSAAALLMNRKRSKTLRLNS